LFSLFSEILEDNVNQGRKTVVCNVKVKYIRPLYSNLKEWMNDPHNVYIGRGGVVFIDGKRFPSQSSQWCNPFKIGKDGSRGQVIKKYREYVERRLSEEAGLRDELLSLKNKILGCWCVTETDSFPSPCSEEHFVCHGQVLAKLIHECEEDEMANQSSEASVINRFLH
jgi:hypothetical protein